MIKHNSLQRCILICLTLVLFIPVTAYAAFYEINTNDGIVDADWSSVTVFNNDGADGGIDDNYDIDQTWITSSSDKQYLYFRASLVGTGRLPGDSVSSFEVRFDCNDDTNFDMVVFYNTYWDDAVECPSSAYWICANATSDWNRDVYGEEISGTPYNYEWMVDTVNGDGEDSDVDWTGCLANPDIWFITTNSIGNIADTTTAREFNLATAITLQDFSANQQNDRFIQMAIYLALVGGVVFLVGKIFFKESDEVSE